MSRFWTFYPDFCKGNFFIARAKGLSMMREVYHLFSGGKDSSLAAWMLSRMGYEVKLVTITFGLLDNWKFARETAEILGFDHEVVKAPREVLEEAVRMCIEDRRPGRAIQYIHEKAL